jgi:hypothetical protein
MRDVRKYGFASAVLASSLPEDSPGDATADGAEMGGSSASISYTCSGGDSGGGVEVPPPCRLALWQHSIGLGILAPALPSTFQQLAVDGCKLNPWR